MTTNDDLVTKLQSAHAARQDPLDIPRTWTQRQVEAYVAETARMAATLSALRNIDTDLAKPLAQRADDEAQRPLTLAKQAELEQQIADAPDWRNFLDGRDRDREYNRQQGLRLQLRLLQEGRLLCAPGVTYRPLTDIDARIAELSAKIEALRATHDAHVQAAEALLGEAATVAGVGDGVP